MKEEQLTELCKGATPRTQKSLRLIYSICEEVANSKVPDLSYANIGRISEQRNGPGPGAIRNKSGAQYRKIIDSFANSIATPKMDLCETILEGCQDPVLSARLQLILAENRSLKTQLNGYKNLLNHSATLDIASPATQKLTPTERRTIEKAIASDTLAAWGWTVDPMGRIISSEGQPVFGPGFVTVLQRLLAS